MSGGGRRDLAAENEKDATGGTGVGWVPRAWFRHSTLARSISSRRSVSCTPMARSACSSRARRAVETRRRPRGDSTRAGVRREDVAERVSRASGCCCRIAIIKCARRMGEKSQTVCSVGISSSRSAMGPVRHWGPFGNGASAALFPSLSVPAKS